MNVLRLLRSAEKPRLVLGNDFGKAGAHDQYGAQIMRGRVVEQSVHLGPNAWHAMVVHPDGTFEDLGVSYNVLTTVGRDLIAAGFGQAAGQDGVLTGSSATSATKTAAGWTVDQYKGWRVWCPVTGVGTSPVYGNIGSNTATVLTIDQWWTAADGVGTTPAATNAYQILPATIARFMGVSAEGTTPVAGDTVLATEQTGNGLARALATYAHTGGVATYTLQKSYSVSGSVTVHKGGLFTAKDTTAAGVLMFAANLNADAIVTSGDTLTVTATVTLT